MGSELVTRGKGKVLDGSKVSYVDAIIGATMKWEVKGHPFWGSVLTYCQHRKREFYSVEEYTSTIDTQDSGTLLSHTA